MQFTADVPERKIRYGPTTGPRVRRSTFQGVDQLKPHTNRTPEPALEQVDKVLDAVPGDKAKWKKVAQAARITAN
jgi:hypothetical protein